MSLKLIKSFPFFRERSIFIIHDFAARNIIFRSIKQKYGEMVFINRWVLTAWAKPWVPFRLSREHDGSSGSQVPSHRRFNVGVIVVHGATAAIKGHGNKLIKMSLPIYIQPGSRGVFLMRDFLSPSNQTTLSKHSIRPALCRTCKAPDRTCFSRYTAPWTWSRNPQTTRSFSVEEFEG